MKRAKELVSLLLCMAMLLAVAACAAPNQTQTPQQSNATTAATTAAKAAGRRTLKVAINADCADLSPFSAAGNGKNMMMYTIYEYLCNQSDVGKELVGVMAKGWKTADDGISYDFEIYNNIYDTAGNHIKADDVVFSYETHKASGNGAKKLKSIEKTGDYTFKMTLTDNFLGTFDQMARSTPIVSKTAYQASADSFAVDPIGTTNYVCSDFVSGSYAKFTKSDKYWQKDKSLIRKCSVANVDEITYTTIKESSQVAIGLETGTIDMAYGIDSIEMERFKSKKGFKIFSTVSNIGWQMYFSGESPSPVAANKDLRQAILYATDKQGIINVVLKGYGVPEYTFGADSFSDFNEAWRKQDYYNFDLNKAKDLLAKAGYKQGQLTLKLMTPNGAQFTKWAQVFQAYMLQIGINVEINAYDVALFNSYLNDGTKYDILLNNTGASDYLTSAWKSKFDNKQFKGKTCTGFADAKLQTLLEEAMAIKTHNAQTMDAFHQYLKDQAYAMGVCNMEVFTVTRDDVTDLTYDAKCFLYAPGTAFAK